MFGRILHLVVVMIFLSRALFAADGPPPKKPGTKWDLMEHGPFLSSYLDATPKINKAVSIKVGNDGTTVCFDTEMCKLALGWVGGFVKLPTGRDGLEGMPKPDSTNIIFTTPAGPGWADADGNFSDKRPEFKGRKYGPLPREHVKWKGIYVSGASTLVSYAVGEASVLESTTGGVAGGNTMATFERRFEITPAGVPLSAIICQAKDGAQLNATAILTNEDSGETFLASRVIIPEGYQAHPIEVWVGEGGLPTVILPGKKVTVVTSFGTGGSLELGTNKCVLLKVDGQKPARLSVHIWRGSEEELPRRTNGWVGMGRRPTDFARSFEKGGYPRWGVPIPAPGKLSADTNSPYVVDTLTVPENNHFNSWIRCSGIDFFKSGTRAAVCSVSGDVWLIDNIDDKLDRVTWRRFATGLFQPLGLRIVDEKIYVLGRDQITRLHDLNKDGEADFYENFNNDIAAFQDYHEFALDLQADSKGNFYFAKGGNLGDARHPHNGSVIKVSKDGSKLEPIANGLRAPNGMGMGPNDEISVSDNEGNWVPASRFSIIKPGGFYGHVNNAFRSPKPTTYDNPVCWLPKNVDNSSGGQVWVDSKRWGPFDGNMLFMSYGHCALFKVLLDKVDGEYQGGVVKFPLRFDTGIMRGRFNQKDGQLYVAGLNVWQSDGARKGAVHRVRYTDKAVNMPTKLHATTKGIELTFTSPLDEATVTDVGNWNVEQWNYKWSSDYGSPEFKVSEPTVKGHDKVEVKSVKLSKDKKTAFLEIPTIQPVMQMKIAANVKSADGKAIKQEIWNSIWKLAAK